MLRKSKYHSLAIAALLTIFLCATVDAAPPMKKKIPKRSVKSACTLPQPRFSLLDSCQLSQQFLALESLESAAVEGFPAPERPRTGLLPFVGKDPNLASLPLPERPAIAITDPLLTPSEQVVAGFTYNQNDRFFFNFGYSLPTAPLQEYAQPFGFTFTEDPDDKRISIGIDIAF